MGAVDDHSCWIFVCIPLGTRLDQEKTIREGLGVFAAVDHYP